MKSRGLLRLSVTVSAFAMIGGACSGTFGHKSLLRELEDFRTYMCVNAPDASAHDLKTCAAELTPDQPALKTEHLSRETYWAEALGFALLMDVVLACFFLGIISVSRWVARGFGEDPQPLEPERGPSPRLTFDIPPEVNRGAARTTGGAFFNRDAKAPARLPAAPTMVLSGSPSPGK